MTQGDLFLTMTADEADEADEAEFYRTPRATVLQLLHSASAIPCGNGTENGLPAGLWVDVGAGDGAIWSVCRDTRPDVTIAPVELRRQGVREGRRHGLERVLGPFVCDWTYPSTRVLRAVRPATVAVMNSAFSLTHTMIRHTFHACPDAWVWSLQRQSWGKPAGDRTTWLMDHWPEYKLQCVGKRPSFTGDGKTDPAEYIWYGWSPIGRNRRYARFEGPCTETPA